MLKNDSYYFTNVPQSPAQLPTERRDLRSVTWYEHATARHINRTQQPSRRLFRSHHFSPVEGVVRCPLKVWKCILRQSDAAGSCGRAETYLDLSVCVTTVCRFPVCLHQSLHLAFCCCVSAVVTVRAEPWGVLRIAAITTFHRSLRDLICSKRSVTIASKNKTLPSFS